MEIQDITSGETMARFGGNTEVASNMAQSLAQGGIGFREKPSEVKLNPLTMQMPYYSIYFFSLYPQPLEKRCGSAGVFKIPACLPGERVSKALVIPSIVRSPYLDALDGVTKTDDIAGERVAEDLMRPFMAGSPESVWSFGNNWDDFGAFWTRNEVPTDEEIDKARTKLEVTFDAALREADTLEATGNLISVTPLMRLAATYREQDRTWNRIFKKTVECPGCGEKVKAGIIMHPQCGYIFDRERYDASFATKKPKTI
jgi:hypothetical protein